MKTASIKTLVAIAALSGIALQASAAPPKAVRIDKTSYSDLYPAVWFHPGDGTVHPITEESESPTVPGAYIWIEPNDPEFAVGQGVEEDVGMCVIGHGPEVFANPGVAGMIARRMQKTKRLDKGVLESGTRPVVVINTPAGSSMVIIEKCDPEASLMEFRWQPIGPGGKSPLVAISPSAAQTERLLKATTVKSVHYTDAVLEEAIEFLRVNFYDANRDYGASLPAPPPGVDKWEYQKWFSDPGAVPRRGINIEEENMSVWDALQEVARQAGLKVEITPRGRVQLAPR